MLFSFVKKLHLKFPTFSHRLPRHNATELKHGSPIYRISSPPSTLNPGWQRTIQPSNCSDDEALPYPAEMHQYASAMFSWNRCIYAIPAFEMKIVYMKRRQYLEAIIASGSVAMATSAMGLAHPPQGRIANIHIALTEYLHEEHLK